MGIKRKLLEPERLIPAIKAQIDSGKSIDGLEEELRANQERLETLDQAAQKALRLHLYLPNYPVDKLEVEQQRIEENRKGLKIEQDRLINQVNELKQAMVDGEGLRRFCEIAIRNSDRLTDERWRVLLETMKVRILINDAGMTVKMAVPTTNEETSVIMNSTSGVTSNHAYEHLIPFAFSLWMCGDNNSVIANSFDSRTYKSCSFQ